MMCAHNIIMIDPDGNYVLLNDIEGRLGEGILWYHPFLVWNTKYQVSLMNTKYYRLVVWNLEHQVSLLAILGVQNKTDYLF